MQRLEVENQIQFTHILKEIVQALDEHVDQVQQRERALRRRRDDDEVQRGVVAVCDEGRRVVGLGLRRRGREEGWEREEVAAAAGSRGDKGEDFGDQALLDCCVLGEALVVMRQDGQTRWKLFK